MKPLLRALAGAVAILLAAAAGAQTANNLREVQIGAGNLDKAAPEPDWLVPTQIPGDRQATTALRILLSDTQINIAGAVPEVYFRRVVQAHTAGAVRDIGQVTIAFVPAYQQVRLHRLTVIRAGTAIDKRASTQLRFLQREAQFEAGVYTGAITIAGLIDDVRPGDVLDVAYTIVGRNPVFADKFSGIFLWSVGAPVLQRRLVLHQPDSRQIQHRFIGPEHLARPRIDNWRSGALRQTVFRQDDLPQFRAEAGAPPSYEPLLWLQFSEYREWSEVADWGQTLFPPSALGSVPELASVIARLKALPDAQSKVREALRFTQGEIRYFSIAFGESSHRPAPPDVVMRRRFGDCKDKSLMLVALLREAGVQARPVLVSTTHGRKLAGWLPTPDLFDHVIVSARVGARDYYIDPTRPEQFGELDRMGQTHEGAYVLPAAAGTKALALIASPNLAELSSASVEETALIGDFSAPALLEVRSRWAGTAAESLYAAVYSRPPADAARFALAFVRQRYPGAEADGDPAVSYDRSANVLSVVEKFRVKELARQVRDDWVVNFVPFNVLGAMRPAPTDGEARRAPLSLSVLPVNVRYAYKATLPEQVSAAFDPVSVSGDSRYFNVSSTRRFKANVVEGELALQSKLLEIPAAEAGDYAKSWRESMEKTVTPVIVMHSLMAGAVQAKPGEDGMAAFARANRARMEAEVAVMGKVIAEGKLPGGDIAGIHELRAGGLASLGRLEEAAADIVQAQRLSPTSGQPLVARAGLARRRGEFAKAIADYNHALALGAEPAIVAEGRGLTYMFQGKFTEAAAEFHRGWDTLKDAERRTWHLIWGINSLARAGKPIPADWRAAAEKEKEGAWPRPILKLFLGDSKPEDLIRSTEGRRDDERYLMLCEAYYQIGIYYLTRKDRATARSYFDKVLATGVLNYTEYEGAGHELAQLK
jgi:transglutaminase-like putative cysteine protease/lipoprotein NlpI